MSTTLSLLSLNEDVLSEILAYILLDTRARQNRTCILQTCSTLHQLGLPHLYAVVDLTWYDYEPSTLERHWKALFGTGGLFSREGGKGQWVRRLRLQAVQHCHQKIKNFAVPDLHLENCTSLTLIFDDHAMSSVLPPLPHIISQLPVQNLWLDFDCDYQTVVDEYYRKAFHDALGLSTQPWPSLQRVTFETTLWYDILSRGTRDKRRLSLSTWSFRTLAIHLEVYPTQSQYNEGRQLLDVLMDPEPSFDESQFLKDTEKITLRLYPELEQMFRAAFERRRGRDGLSAFNRRIAEMILFVDEVGTERQLLEGH